MQIEVFNPALDRNDPRVQLSIQYRCAVEAFHAVRAVKCSDISSRFYGNELAPAAQQSTIEFLRVLLIEIADRMEEMDIHTKR